MSLFKHPTKAQILRLHAQILLAHGGADGLRNESLLESAIAAPQATFNGQAIIPDAIEAAAAYLFYLCKNHPFVDGNKRVALTTCLVFLRLNGHHPKPDGEEWELLTFDVAASRIDREGTAGRLRQLLDS